MPYEQIIYILGPKISKTCPFFTYSKEIDMYIQKNTHILPSTFSHSHPNYEIQFGVSGIFTYHYYPVQGSSYAVELQIKPGMLVFCPKGVCHGVSNVRYPYERFWAQFTDEDLQDMHGSTGLLNFLASGDQLLPVIWDLSSNLDRFSALCDRAYSAYMNDSLSQKWKQLYLINYFGLLFCEINRFYPQYFSGFTPNNLSQTISQVKQYIDEHYNEAVKLADIADRFHYSPGYLTRQFTDQIGISPRQYLTNKRLSMARKDLCSTSLSIQEIAINNGFGDVNYFIQVYKKTYGTTPKKYQRRVRTMV